MYYQFFEWNHAFLSPARAVNDAVRLYYRNPLNPLTHTEFGRQIAAAGDLFERMTRRYGKPEFGITETMVDGVSVPVSEKIVWERPFCKLLKFEREMPAGSPPQPNLVLVAPMSGHYATLLRGTVEALLPHNNVYITDWVDARKVPLAVGRFNLDDFVDYIIDIIAFFEGDAHLVAVCQPAVPVFAATALLESRQSAHLPRSITLMGGPIDTRQNPTEVNTYALKHDLDWFRRNVIMPVPFPHPGVMRKVYPGFLQLTGFMTMNLDRHLAAHYDYFDDLVKGDGDSADKHREFYDEYLSVMDLTAEFYLQTVDTVFLRHALPKGEMLHHGEPVDPRAITRTPILTIEGEKDDISGIGQTKAAHTLSPNLPDEKHRHYEQSDVGHYGVFNGSRFRKEIAPRICAFVREWDDDAPDTAALPDASLTADTLSLAAAVPNPLETVAEAIAEAPAETVAEVSPEVVSEAPTAEVADTPADAATENPATALVGTAAEAIAERPEPIAEADAPASTAKIETPEPAPSKPGTKQFQAAPQFASQAADVPTVAQIPSPDPASAQARPPQSKGEPAKPRATPANAPSKGAPGKPSGPRGKRNPRNTGKTRPGGGA